ncbi:MAG: lytic polysaccharide monooxygenase [Bryobacteraceae bacterium]|nr:lytic polysaccharide monooxygenase [Bryobacteraceae bacterium]
MKQMIQTGVLCLSTAAFVFAHGALEIPLSRVYGCYLSGNASAACKAAVALGGAQAVYDWNGVNIGDVAGRHRERIADGRLCSASREQHKGFDLPRADWPAVRIQPDTNMEFVFRGTAPHATSYFRFYVTRDGYDPTRSLAWADLEAQPFCEPQWSLSEGRYRMVCRTPRKTGRHLIYTIWQRSDSPEAFYSCSDVDFGGGGAPAPGLVWTQVGRIQAVEDLPVASTVTLRVFDGSGSDVESHRLVLAAGQTGAADWPFALASFANSRSNVVRAGQQDSGGGIAPVRSAAGNLIYSRQTDYRVAVDILKPPPVVIEPSGVMVYPQGRDGYVAGTVVKATDGKLYRCRPFPNSGWCRQWDLYYAPGTGLAWREAWVRVN